MSEHGHKRPPGEKPGWLDNAANVNRLLWVLYLACAAVFAADFFYVKKMHFVPPENIPAFYGLYGFAAFVVIVFGGKLLRRIVMRDEDYYDR